MSNAESVNNFFDLFMKPTGHISEVNRAEELDNRIRNAELDLNAKIDVFRRLSPAASVTDPRKELRMERLLLSIRPEDLATFKFALEYDGDYKDITEYLFHDIDDEKRQARIVEHFRRFPKRTGIKVLTDVDDTMYANLVDERYPKKTVYPGVLEFYDSLKREPFNLSFIPVTTLSARPNPFAGRFEEASIEGLVKMTNGRLHPSGLSGELVSSTVGSLETLLRAKLSGRNTFHQAEDKIGIVKFGNFTAFSQAYPEYGYVFLGDSGQADALTAELMLTEDSVEGTSRVITTFIHDLRSSSADEKAISPAFKRTLSRLFVTDESSSGRGIILFRNYISAAVTAHEHSVDLEHLIDAARLARITRAALAGFREINFASHEAFRMQLQQQYKEDAEAAFILLEKASVPRLDSDVRDIRQMLDQHFVIERGAQP